MEPNSIELNADEATVSVSEPEALNESETYESEDIIYRKPKRKIRKIIIPIVVILLIAAAVFYMLTRAGRSAILTSATYTEHTVENHDITVTLSGTGTLKPADSYTVTTLISGEILNAPFEEGDVVEKGLLLYEVDSADAANSIEQAEISLAQSRRSYTQKLESLDDLSIKATESGEIVELMVAVGDKINNGQTVAMIRDRATMSLKIFFTSDDAAGFYVGQSAEVTLDGSFEVINGVIYEVSALQERLDGNMLVRRVTIDVSNPGGIAADQVATAMVGDIACNSSGSFSYKTETTVTSSATGDVAEIYAHEGDRVSKNQTIISLTSTALANEITNSADAMRNSELSLQSRYDQLDNYSITSPISGTIIEKNYKLGDTLESGKILCTIFDLSYLTMTLNIDELDITTVSAGQSVEITVEALPDSVYEGTVTKVNINGTTTGGTTSYPVTIRIDKTDGLLPGMNVQASIVVTSKKDVVAIPVGALSRGNIVLVKTDALSDQTANGFGGLGGMRIPDGQEVPDGMRIPDRREAPDGIRIPDGREAPDGMRIPGGQGASDGTRIPGGTGTTNRQGAFNNTDIPEGFTYRIVTPGASDGEYIEITSGLSAGDVIAYIDESISPTYDGSVFYMTGMPAGGGGMAMPAGGGGGGGRGNFGG